ncbi:tRNA (cytosine(49)-C(5))-methyltransferase [uncultured archaeon]|nr:tRNA (cytosine(49)-C(5))-methyltransferase [uncultured archaeon]
MDDFVFGEELVARFSGFTDWERFKASLVVAPVKSIRVNTLKTTVSEINSRLSEDWILTPVPWCPEGFWVEDKKKIRSDLGNIPEHNLGYFFVQEASSMIPALVLGPKPGERVLDMCASPGGKTTQIAQLMQNRGEVVAADVRDDRIAILKRNVERMGASCVKVVKKPGQQFKDEKFDRILVDAPCSASGTMRGEPDKVAAWNLDVAKRISYEQKSLLHAAYCVLKRGGILVYSTCSMEPEENEAVIDWLLKRHKKTEVEKINLPGLNRSQPILKYGNAKYDPRIGK